MYLKANWGDSDFSEAQLAFYRLDGEINLNDAPAGPHRYHFVPAGLVRPLLRVH